MVCKKHGKCPECEKEKSEKEFYEFLVLDVGIEEAQKIYKQVLENKYI